MLLLVVLSEESRLSQLHFDAIASLVVIPLVELEADEVSLLTDGCNGGGAAANTVVQYGVSPVGVGADEVLNKSHGLLSRVDFTFLCGIAILQNV